MWARGGPGSAEILRSCQGGWGPTRERKPRKNNPEWYSTARELDGPRCTNQSRGPDSSRSSHTCAEVCDHRGDRWPAVVTAGAQRPSLGSCRVACSEDVAAFGTPPSSAHAHLTAARYLLLCTRGARGECSCALVERGGVGPGAPGATQVSHPSCLPQRPATLASATRLGCLPSCS